MSFAFMLVAASVVLGLVSSNFRERRELRSRPPEDISQDAVLEEAFFRRTTLNAAIQSTLLGIGHLVTSYLTWHSSEPLARGLHGWLRAAIILLVLFNFRASVDLVARKINAASSIVGLLLLVYGFFPWDSSQQIWAGQYASVLLAVCAFFWGFVSLGAWGAVVDVFSKPPSEITEDGGDAENGLQVEV